MDHNMNNKIDMCAFMEFQVEQILTHKYLESKKAGRDLGQEAVNDWIRKYAKDVRSWAEKSGKFCITGSTEKVKKLK